MKRTVLSLSILFTILTSGCIKDLPRDNPNDSINDVALQDGIALGFSYFDIVDDDNGDKKANKNETVYLRIYIENFGTEEANGVKALITSSSPYVDDLSPSTTVPYNSGYSNYDYISPGSEEYGQAGRSPNNSYYSLSFTIKKETPANARLKFALLITDDANHEWYDSLEVVVEQTGALITFGYYDVVHDNNEDDIVNQNEDVYLRLYLKNSGTSRANGVEAEITSSSSNITDLSPSGFIKFNSGYPNYDYINTNSFEYGYTGRAPSNSYYTFSFKVASQVQEGTEIPFTLNIKDVDGNTWTDEFTVVVEKTGALVKFERYEVVEDDNDNDKINPGETVYLRIHLKNEGLSRADGVEGKITTGSSYISNINPSGYIEYHSGYPNYHHINVGNTEYGYTGRSPSNQYYTLSLTVNSSTPLGSSLNLDIDIQDQEGNIWTDTFDIEVE